MHLEQSSTSVGIRLVLVKQLLICKCRLVGPADKCPGLYMTSIMPTHMVCKLTSRKSITFAANPFATTIAVQGVF